eukprot:CAMPEP_0181080554 /NCGR_PEP_ID=MMETSP1071-20121207/2628_1 /TAXON_ID=35127 /ORGANISM="Thalassiosira sp., Strain NH16" /LENGTH=264 /DNA_ID=CAMNT_0023162037 /DNA_START=109 /DNA_END=899 /DNA_ORIENTATION=-
MSFSNLVFFPAYIFALVTTAKVSAFQQPTPYLYRGESVVLTGSTGFIGMCALKTLLLHTDVERVILPVRINREQTIENASLSNVIDKYGKELGISIDNPIICPVPVTNDDCCNYLDGISHAPNDILSKCSTILHLAGNTDWVSEDELIESNLQSTMRFLEGADDVLPNVNSFLFTSTGFAEAKNKVSQNSPVPEGTLSVVCSENTYFSGYGKVKAMTEHAIEDWVNHNSGQTNIHVSIFRPGTSIGLDGVPVGWYTNNKSLAAA